jgi:hypothetical protein
LISAPVVLTRAGVNPGKKRSVAPPPAGAWAAAGRAASGSAAADAAIWMTRRLVRCMQ